MRARPIDAAEGYRLYRSHAGDVQLDEINEYLRGLGLRPVSPRMYIHYERLLRAGYSSYIPINRFDIAVAGEHAWSDELRARYPEIRQPLEGELLWNAAVFATTVESLGSTTATATTRPPPPAGSSVVLRLSATGISRTGTIVRSDPSTGRIHVAFDPYTSVPIAPRDSPFHASLRFQLSDEAESIVTFADIMLTLDRLMWRASKPNDSLARVTRISLQNPFEIVLVGSAAVVGAAKLIGNVVEIRKTWYEGTKAKYESEGIRLDNAQKRRNAQLEADRSLRSALEDEFDSEDQTPLLDAIETPTLHKGDKGSEERRQLLDTAYLALDLPAEVDVESGQGPENHST